MTKRHRFPQLLDHPGHCRMGCHSQVHYLAPRMTQDHKHVERRVGTVKKSIAQEICRWLCRKVSQLWDFSPPPLGLSMYLRIVSGQGGSKPSSTKCPWIVSALHRTFSRLKRRINARISWLIAGRPPFRRDFQPHHCRKASACHWRTVLGFIRSAADFHPLHTLDSNIHKRRNAG